MGEYPRIGQFHDVAALIRRLASCGQPLPCDARVMSAAEGSPLAAPCQVADFRVGNRWCIQPMEGWDGELDGNPSELTRRRWQRFGASGAKLIWGGEAVAVEPLGRANPRQLWAHRGSAVGLGQLLASLRAAHRERFDTDADLLVGLQLTHSGRFARPHGQQLEPRLAHRHPLLDEKFGLPSDNPVLVWSDAELDDLLGRFVDAARLAQELGFQFVDIKACHGYLIHELLGAHTRPGRYGGDYAGRTRFLRSALRAVRTECPSLMLGVRLSAIDCVPYTAIGQQGHPMPFAHLLPYRWGFGVDPRNPLVGQMSEALQLVSDLADDGVALVNVSVGSPYYNHHWQRPAAFPPSDGYAAPEDPLLGVARQIQVAREVKQALPRMVVVGTGYSYLQDFLPHVAQGVVRAGWVDFVGLGRMVLSYPELPTDCLVRGSLVRKRICRTFSDCTSGPRLGLVSGCFPLDPFYKARPEAAALRAAKSLGNNSQAAPGSDQHGAP